MAGVGEAASIAGLIAVAGQCLDLLSKLYTLVKAFQDVFPQARKLADELTLLRQCLSQIQNIASRAANIVPDLSEPVKALFTAVSRCENTVLQIEQKIQTIHPSEKKLIWNRVKVAAARNFFTLLQAQVLSEKQDLILRLDAFSCELDLRTSFNIEHLAASTSSLERNVIDMMQHLDGHSGATERHLLALDARMQAMQQMLEHRISPQRRTAMTPRSRRMQLKAPRHVSQIAKKFEPPRSRIFTRIPEPASESVRLISPAFLVYEKNGTTHTELVALNNGELNRLNVAQKSRMIQYLQGLRLFMWLLKRDNYLTTNSTKDLGMIRSSLAVHAGITSFWEFSNAFSDLATSLDAISYTTLSWLPWLKNKPWLQYVFNRILDWPGDRGKVMELVLKRWPSFPLPDDEFGKFTLSIPARLLRDTQLQEIWNSYSETSIRNGPLDLSVDHPLVCSHMIETRNVYEHRDFMLACSSIVATGNDEIPQSFNTLPWPDFFVEPLQEPQDFVTGTISCKSPAEGSHQRRAKYLSGYIRRTAKFCLSC